MGALEVRAIGQRLTLTETDRLAFGRVNTDPDGSRGWDYEGRFLELSPRTYVHRIWGEIVCEGGLWRIRSLGQIHPVTVVPSGLREIELPPRGDDDVAPEYAVTQPRFEIRLSVGAESFRLLCAQIDGVPVGSRSVRPVRGDVTVTLRDEMAECVTATEYHVLRAMARDYLAEPRIPDPQPLSYTRIRRSLGLTHRQTTSAAARAIQRFRDKGLMPPEVTPEQQRDWLCRQLVAHGVFDELARRHLDASPG